MTDQTIPRADRIIARCRQLAACTQVPGEITRLFLSPPMHQVHTLIRGWMESVGMTVHIDAIGNIRGLRQSETPDAPRLLIASHLDTVPNAGAFDGILGVLLGVTLIEELDTHPLPFDIELIGFSEEEGVRFSKPFLGSLALTGQLDIDTLACIDKEGITLTQAIRDFGLSPYDLPSAVLSNTAFAYLEVHIEQGPILESEDSSLGIVDAIVGQSRLQLTFTGQANHAGTTPMDLRRDALTAAAEWVVAVEAFARSHPGLVATVGKLQPAPGAVNVIPGEVTASLDVRHPQDQLREDAVDSLIESATQIAARRRIDVAWKLQSRQLAVPMNHNLTRILESAATGAGYTARIMTSGAGHDAMILAPHIPSTMLFLRSPGGISHHPDEAVLPHDVEAAVATGLQFIYLLRDHPFGTSTSLLKDAHA